MKAYLMGAAGTAGLYAALKLALPHLTGPVAWLLSGYGADVLAGGMILRLFNCVLLAFRIPPIRRALPAAGFLLLCGLFWEYVTPLYRPGAVSDPWDLLAYVLGGLGMVKVRGRSES